VKGHQQVDGEWRLYATCRGMPHEMFFPKRGQSTWRAKKICADCMVKDECLEDAIIRREPAGIRGGMSTRERQVLIRERRKNQDV
jgi:WhiB family redox-sensing transcriptional regulator